jgi:ethanolamine utilization protein EutM
MQNQSLGLIETWGYTAAVEAVDVACKAARVLFVGHDRIGKGFITVKFSGDVAAVQAAVTAGAAAARRVGRVISVHVIPRPHDQLGALGPGFPDMPKGMDGVSEPPSPVQPRAEEDKPVEQEHVRPLRAKKAAGRGTAKGPKTGGTGRKQPK